MTSPAAPAHLFLSEEDTARLVLGPGREKEWPAKLKQLRGFPPINPFYGGRYRVAVERFIANDVGLPLPGGGQDTGDEYVTVVPYAPDSEDDNARKTIPLDRRRRTVRA